MACNKPYCVKCTKEEKPISKIKERLKKKIESKKLLETNFVGTTAIDVKQLVANFENIESAKLFIRKQILSNKPQLEVKASTSSAEVVPEKKDDEEKTKKQKERVKKDPQIEKDISNEIQKMVDFIEGKDRDAEQLKKQKTIEKRAKRREKKLAAKQNKDLQLKDKVLAQSKESEAGHVQNSSDIKNITINHESKEESVTLSLSLTGSSVLIEKIIAAVIEAVPDVKESMMNIVQPENNTTSKNTGAKQKKNMKQQLKQESDEPNLKNAETSKTPNSKCATIIKMDNGMVTIKRPVINDRKLKIDCWKALPAQDAILDDTKTKMNKENLNPNKSENKMEEIKENLDHVIHDLPEITITRREKK